MCSTDPTPMNVLSPGMVAAVVELKPQRSLLGLTEIETLPQLTQLWVHLLTQASLLRVGPVTLFNSQEKAQ